MPTSGILHLRRALFPAALLLASAPLAATDYNLGSAAQTRPGVPVANIAALNRLVLRPGDRVFFQGGESFTGSIVLRPEDAGTPDRPVSLSSFGNGRATILAGDGAGIVIDNAGGISISRLELVGAAKELNAGSGIEARAELPDNSKIEYLRFDDLRISGFRFGVDIWGWHSTDTRAWPGFRDVLLSRLEVFDNYDEGIRIWGTWYPDGDGRSFSHEDFLIRDCVVHDNKGDPTSETHTGSGIVVSGVDGAVIERCIAHDNGGLGPATGGGPFGIWVFEASNCTLQYNLVYNQRTSSRSDGGAFDLDGGSSNCVVQYNYSYQNDGPAIALIQFDDASPLTRNVVRYNISENDSRDNAQGAIYVGQFSTTQGIEQADFYGNTVFVSTNRRGERPPAVRVEDHARLTNIRLRNNLFVATHNGALVGGALTKPGTALYQGNNYWGGSFDLAAFRRGGQETLAGFERGYRLDPQLVAPGQGGVVQTLAELATSTAYQLQSGSELAGAGLDLAVLFGIDPGSRDFFGQPISSAALPVGAARGPDGGASPIRTVNLSVRSQAGQQSETLILGFVIRGAGTADVLVRGIGPGLIPIGMKEGTLGDPRLTLFEGGAALVENDNWGGGGTLTEQFAKVGAFPLDSRSKDAALSRSLRQGVYTAHVTAAGNARGLALVELYDATKSNARFINVSTRTQVGTGDNIVIAGFVLEGQGEKRLLIRGAGPSLAKLGLDASTLLRNPQLTLFRGSTPVAGNDDWAGSAALNSAFTTVGAFAFDNAASSDAALLVALKAGAYTVHLSGVGGTNGVGLVEIYDVP